MKDHITPESIANDIRMRRTQVKKAFLIVEGQKDFLTLNRFVDEESCQIIICFGKENALSCADILNNDCFSGYLAIADADHDRILGSCAEDRNIIITELHDLDCILLVSPATYRVLEELGSKDRIEEYAEEKGHLITNALADAAKPVGCLRLHSTKNNLNLKFDGLAFDKFLDRQSIDCDIPSLVNAVLNNSQRHDLRDSGLDKTVFELLDQGHELWQIVCGHDVIKVLSFALRKRFAARNTQDVAPEKLEQHMRLALDKDDFYSTELATSIYNWEKNNTDYKILLDS